MRDLENTVRTSVAVLLAGVSLTLLFGSSGYAQQCTVYDQVTNEVAPWVEEAQTADTCEAIALQLQVLTWSKGAVRQCFSGEEQQQLLAGFDERIAVAEQGYRENCGSPAPKYGERPADGDAGGGSASLAVQ